MRVTDNGVPPLSHAGSFRVIVLSRPLLMHDAVSGNLFPLIFATLPGCNYQVEFKNNLTEAVWNPLGSSFRGDGNSVQITDDISTQSQRYYRVRVLP